MDHSSQHDFALCENQTSEDPPLIGPFFYTTTVAKTGSGFLSVNEKSALVLHGSFPKSENVLGRDWENFSS